VIEMPGKHFAIIDAGCFFENGNRVIENQLPEMIEPGSEIDLLLSATPIRTTSARRSSSAIIIKSNG